MIPKIFTDWVAKKNFVIGAKGQFIGNLRIVPVKETPEFIRYKCLGTLYQNPTHFNPEVSILEDVVIIPDVYDKVKHEI